jgi:trimethylamine corrinoid protein
MEKKKILENLAVVIAEGDEDKAKESAQQALKNHIDPLEAIEQGLSKGMAAVGERFEKGEAYLPELLMAANNFNAAMEILEPEIEAQQKKVTKLGKILIGTVKGDVHNIGKNIVSTVLNITGFEVIDLGVDISSLSFVEEAEKRKVDLIALSSLMTTTMGGQKEVIDILREKKVRDRYLVMVGGGPVTSEWTDKIGADGYGRNAMEAVEVAKELLLKAHKTR